MAIQTTLTTLRDIEGVLGSFLIDESGQLLVRDMPGAFDDETLNSASQRLSRLRGALESEASFGGCVARFGEHLLVVRPVAKQLLCVLVPRGANLTALQMVTNLVSRRLALLAGGTVHVDTSARPSTIPAPAEPTLSGVSPMVPLSVVPVPTPPPLPSVPAPPPKTTIALLARTKLAPSDHQDPPPRESAPLVDPHPTRPLPKRFFRGRPVD